MTEELLTVKGAPRKLRDDEEFHSAFATMAAMKTEVDARRAAVAEEVQRLQNDLNEEVAEQVKALKIREAQLICYATANRERLCAGKKTITSDAGSIEFRAGRETLVCTVQEETAIKRMQESAEGRKCLDTVVSISKMRARALDAKLLKIFGLKLETGAESVSVKIASQSQKK